MWWVELNIYFSYPNDSLQPLLLIITYHFNFYSDSTILSNSIEQRALLQKDFLQPQPKLHISLLHFSQIVSVFKKPIITIAQPVVFLTNAFHHISDMWYVYVQMKKKRRKVATGTEHYSIAIYIHLDWEETHINIIVIRINYCNYINVLC